MKRRMMPILLVAAMLACMLGGCGDTAVSTSAENVVSNHTSEAAAAETPAAGQPESGTSAYEEALSTAEELEADPSVPYELPLFAEGKTFTMWKSINSDLLSTTMPNGYLDNFAYQKSVELTNVNIDYITVSSSAAVEQFGIMLATGTYPDMIANLSSLVSDSFDTLIEQEILIDLYPYVMDCMPVYQSLLDKGGDNLYLETLTDAGQMGAICSIQLERDDPIYGLAIRQDWLDALGLEIPKTYEKLTTVATAFQTELGATEPIHYLGLYDFCEGFGVVGYNVNFNPFATQYQGFYQVDGEVKFGLVEDGYRDYLEVVSDWYAKGLIHAEFYTYNQNRNGSEAEAARLGNYCGIVGINPNNLDYYEENAEDPNYNLSAMAYPTVTEGEQIHLAEYSSYTAPVISVTTDCSDVESVVTWLDWWYTDQGSDLANYGVEGLTMNYDENGKPQYTELYTQNDGSIISDDEFPQLYFYQIVGCVTIPDGVKSFYSDKAKSFPAVWMENQDDTWSMPPISLNTEEGETFSETFSDISTLFATYLPQFVTGERPLSEWDSFVQKLYDMGIEDCIACWQAALDRYNSKLA